MNELLNNPAVQAGVAPFLVALAAAAVLGRGRFLAIAIAAGFLTAVALVMGLSFDPMTSVRKMVVAGLIMVVIALVIEFRGLQASPRLRVMLATLAGGAAVWTVIRVLLQKDVGMAVLAGAGAATYLVLLVEFTCLNGKDTLRSAASALMLGMGAGALALVGASAMLGQIGISVGAAAGAVLLVQMLTGRAAAPGWTLALPANAISGFVVLLAVATGELRWYSLVPLLALPWITQLVPERPRALWLTAILAALVAMVPMLVAVGLAWSAVSTPTT